MLGELLIYFNKNRDSTKLQVQFVY